jgi:hypothetical protein
MGVIGISLKLISAPPASIFAAGERIFRYAGLTSKLNDSSWWKRLLTALRIRKPIAIEI